MSKKIHAEFVQIAGGISEVLRDAIGQAQPVKLKTKRDKPLPEVLCRAVAGQQLSTKAAATIWGRVVSNAGDQPLLTHIANAGHDELRACGLSNAKSKAMKAIADAELQRQLDVTTLEKLTHADRSEILTSILGVGQWTADMIGIFYFGDRDVWPEKDVTVWKTLQRLTGKRRRLSLTAARFAPNRSYLALYMYHIADVGRPTS